MTKRNPKPKKLNLADVYAIRQLYAEGKSENRLADQFNVTQAIISYIVSDKDCWLDRGHMVSSINEQL